MIQNSKCYSRCYCALYIAATTKIRWYFKIVLISLVLFSVTKVELLYWFAELVRECYGAGLNPGYLNFLSGFFMLKIAASCIRGTAQTRRYSEGQLVAATIYCIKRKRKFLSQKHVQLSGRPFNAHLEEKI